MAKQLVQGTENRLHTRYAVKCIVNVSVNGSYYRRNVVENFSVKGLLIRGEFNCKPADEVELEFLGNHHNSGLRIILSARVVRIGDHSLALEVTNIDSEAYLLLQTIIQYCSSDPYGIALDHKITTN